MTIRKYASKSTTLEDLVKERFGFVTGDEIMAWVWSHGFQDKEEFHRGIKTVWAIKEGYENGTFEVRGNKVTLKELGGSLG